MAANRVGGKFVKKTMAQGMGESRVFAQEQAFDPCCPKGVDILTCHFEGILVSELGEGSKLFYSDTDEGKEWYGKMRAEVGRYAGGTREAGASGRGMKLADGRIATDEEEKKNVKYRDELSTHFDEGRAAEDPFAEPMRLHTPPGHRGLFMSLKQCERQGLNRGGLKYEPVLVKNRESGSYERVIVLGMFLASVPEEAARQAEAYYERRNKEKQITVNERVRQQSDQVMSEAGLHDLAKRKHVLEDLIGNENEDGQMADAELVHQFVDRD